MSPATIIDSRVFGDIFSSAPMREVFSDENRVAQYLVVEAALARAQGRLGVIPQQAADEIVRHCKVAEIDFGRLKARTERIGYPVLPVVEQLVENCADGLGQYCTGAPPPRTSPTRRRSCRSARPSAWSRPI
jgi:3-carboxy-cis,cis-muconate cycloisomerase